MVWRKRVEAVGREGGRACVWGEDMGRDVMKSTRVSHLGTSFNSPSNTSK